MKDNFSLIDTIEPKSDQINYDDFLSGPKTFTIEKVGRGSDDQPVVIKFMEHDRYYKPCLSMRRVLIAAWGDKGTEWIERRLTLFGDSGVIYAGVKVGGVRISHMSDIDGPVVVKLTTRKSKREDYTVNPITDKPVAK